MEEHSGLALRGCGAHSQALFQFMLKTLQGAWGQG